MDDDDEKADEISRYELKKANERDQEIRYNHSLSTADAKPHGIPSSSSSSSSSSLSSSSSSSLSSLSLLLVDVEHILDNYKWDDLDNENFPDDEPPHFSYTNYTRLT